MEADLGIIGLSLLRQRLQNFPCSSVLSSSLHALGCSSPYCSSTFCVRKGPGKKDGNAQSSEDTDSKWGVWFSVTSYWSNSSLPSVLWWWAHHTRFFPFRWEHRGTVFLGVPVLHRHTLGPVAEAACLCIPIDWIMTWHMSHILPAALLVSG